MRAVWLWLASSAVREDRTDRPVDVLDAVSAAARAGRRAGTCTAIELRTGRERRVVVVDDRVELGRDLAARARATPVAGAGVRRGADRKAASAGVGATRTDCRNRCSAHDAVGNDAVALRHVSSPAVGVVQDHRQVAARRVSVAATDRAVDRRAARTNGRPDLGDQRGRTIPEVDRRSARRHVLREVGGVDLKRERASGRHRAAESLAGKLLDRANPAGTRR